MKASLILPIFLLGVTGHSPLARAQSPSPQTPAVAGEILSMYVSGLAEGGAIPPQGAVGGPASRRPVFRGRTGVFLLLPGEFSGTERRDAGIGRDRTLELPQPPEQ